MIGQSAICFAICQCYSPDLLAVGQSAICFAICQCYSPNLLAAAKTCVILTYRLKFCIEKTWHPLYILNS